MYNNIVQHFVQYFGKQNKKQIIYLEEHNWKLTQLMKRFLEIIFFSFKEKSIFVKYLLFYYKL